MLNLPEAELSSADRLFFQVRYLESGFFQTSNMSVTFYGLDHFTLGGEL